MTAPAPPVVTTEWLAARLESAAVRVVDGSWYLPGSGRDAANEYSAGHIPGAVFFDLDATSDPNTRLPHMLPTADQFADRMASLGLSDSDHIVIYDGSGQNLSAPRVWWMFRAFGHDRVSVLDGGLGKWRREQRETEQGSVTLARGAFTARLDRAAVRDLESVRANIDRAVEQLVDTRSTGRFAGVDPEPRAGLRGGHVPGSLNLPFTDLVRPDGTVWPADELHRRLLKAGVDLSRPVVAICGSGTSACALVLSLHLIGHTRTAVYDGAWAEWGGRSDTPIESDIT
ncbi:MAG TPA: 3-mercaptopyruvate sulfurtransferase [Gemmatimonadales bacterium]|nr:3-mercaptopyruvate sulfurtransferase [Gemmatimonadales bacterium]